MNFQTLEVKDATRHYLPLSNGRTQEFYHWGPSYWGPSYLGPAYGVFVGEGQVCRLVIGDLTPILNALAVLGYRKYEEIQ